MSMAWIRKTYSVPAKRGGRVIYSGKGKDEYGTIRSARGAHLYVQLDGSNLSLPFHPIWRLKYLA